MIRAGWNYIDPRTIYGAMAAIICISLLASYFYLLKSPLNVYGKLQSEKALLQARAEAGTDLAADIARIEDETRVMETRLQGELPPESVSQILTHIIARLDEISLRHGIRLVSVEPGEVRATKVFEEILFTVKISGRYLDMYGWLRQLEEDLGAMVVKEFHVMPEKESGVVSMEMRVAAFRPAEGTP